MATINGLGGANHALYAYPTRRNPAAPMAGPAQPASPPSAGWQADARQSAGLTPAEGGIPQTARDEFLAYMEMTPAEKMRYSILSEMGLTEEQLAAMPADERAQVEKKIEELIKERLDVQANEDMHAALRPATAFNLSLMQQIQANEEERPKVDIFS